MRPVDVIEAICDAIQHYEGWNATSRSYRNRNPGNLRAVVPGQAVDKDGYRVFESALEGYDHLYADIAYKISGRNTHGLSASSSLLQLFSVYAPQADHNAPVAYAAFVATWLRQVYASAAINTDTTIADIFKAAGQEVPVGQHNTGHSSAVSGSVPEIPADRVDSGNASPREDWKITPADVGTIVIGGDQPERLPDDRPTSSPEAAE